MAKILIIDDNEKMRTLVGTVLTDEGHLVYGAENGVEGCTMAEAICPDLVITDLWMPRREGIETVRMIRAYYPAARIIVMSGRPVLADVSLFKVARRNGADAAITKPFGRQDIVRLVDEMLSGLRSTATNGNALN